MTRYSGVGQLYFPETSAVRNPGDMPRIKAYLLTRIGKKALSIPLGTGYHRPKGRDTASVEKSSVGLRVSVMHRHIDSTAVQQTRRVLGWGDYGSEMPFITADRAVIDVGEHGEESRYHEQSYSTSCVLGENTLNLGQIALAIWTAKELQLATP
jgi:hypothetical protein